MYKRTFIVGTIGVYVTAPPPPRVRRRLQLNKNVNTRSNATTSNLMIRLVSMSNKIGETNKINEINCLI